MTVTETSPETTASEADAAVDADVATDAQAAPEVIDEVLVEEISIDGMCGVY